MASDCVILVHGLWMNGAELRVLRNRLRKQHGFDVYVFSYPTRHGDMAAICSALADFSLSASQGRPVHFVGHSLGGAVVYRTLQQCAERLSGNAVVLGSPLNGCRAAIGAARWSVLRPLLGELVLTELGEPSGRSWQGTGALGAIAGSRRVGTGRFFAHFHEDHDGTVAVSETVIPGLADHLVLRHSHIGMLFARDVSQQVASFLREARFRR